MYDKRLDTLLAVAEYGSFNKAAKEIGYSTPALIKQVNAFEAEIGISIFDRSNKGICLTSNGECFLEDAKEINAQCNMAVDEAKRREKRESKLIRLGIGGARAGQRVLERCHRVFLQRTDMNIQLIPIVDTYEDFLHAIKSIGTDIDIVSSIYMGEEAERLCSCTIIGNPNLCLSVPYSDELADRDIVDVSELSGRRIRIRRPGNPYIDSAREEIAESAIGVEFVEFEHYSIGIFNECALRGDILLSKEIWRDVHPSMKTVDVRWNKTVPYCLYYAKEPTEDVRSFVEAIRSIPEESRIF